MIHKAMIYPKLWAHKKIQIKKAQDHEYAIDSRERYWAIKS